MDLQVGIESARFNSKEKSWRRSVSGELEVGAQIAVRRTMMSKRKMPSQSLTTMTRRAAMDQDITVDAL